MNLFINHFAFTEPRKDIVEQNIIEALDSLGKLFIILKKINIELAIHQSLSQVLLLGKPIREYIQKVNDSNTKKSIISLVSKIKPICTDIDTAFENDSDISFGNCKEKIGDIDVLYTFLSCSMYYQDPILTINNLCSKEQFSNNIIDIICDSKTYSLNNYKLIPYAELISKLEEYQKDKKLDEYNQIDNWTDYEIFVNKNYKYVKITKHCMIELSKRYSYNNSYSDIFRKKVKRFNDLILENGGKPKEINFSPLGLGTRETNKDIISLKKSHPGIKNFEGDIVSLNWHEYIQSDCRVYFEKEDNYVCFVHYEKKIDR